MNDEKELIKIPQICKQKPCYFELLKEQDGRGVEYIKKLARDKCPKICPKYDAKFYKDTEIFYIFP